MKHILLAFIIAGIAFAGRAQENKYYRYGSKFVHNEYLRLDSSERKIYFKGANNKMERQVKIVNGNYIIPGRGKCRIITSGGGLYIKTSQGEEYLYRPLQNCDKPLKQYPRKCRSGRTSYNS